MAENMQMDYLYRCYELHGDLKRLYFDRHGRAAPRLGLAEVEAELAGVRGRARSLTYEDLQIMRNTEVWDAEEFGYWPRQEELEENLRAERLNFWNLPGTENVKIERLLDVFRQIELVSVILRFVEPIHYGIMSPPVERILGIGPYPTHVERYQSYLSSIRQLRDDRDQFEQAAQIDMALWVLEVGILKRRLERLLSQAEIDDISCAYEADRQLQAIRVGNLTRQILLDSSRAELAEALLENAVGERTLIDLAGQLAGIEFERLVGILAHRRVADERTLRDMVCEVRPNGDELHVNWRNAVRTRNRAIHLRNPSVNDVRNLIRAMNEAEALV